MNARCIHFGLAGCTWLAHGCCWGAWVWQAAYGLHMAAAVVLRPLGNSLLPVCLPEASPSPSPHVSLTDAWPALAAA